MLESWVEMQCGGGDGWKKLEGELMYIIVWWEWGSRYGLKEKTVGSDEVKGKRVPLKQINKIACDVRGL
jgi:hypothetical protein